jgi:hypothetical protein
VAAALEAKVSAGPPILASDKSKFIVYRDSRQRGEGERHTEGNGVETERGESNSEIKKRKRRRVLGNITRREGGQLLVARVDLVNLQGEGEGVSQYAIS